MSGWNVRECFDGVQGIDIMKIADAPAVRDGVCRLCGQGCAMSIQEALRKAAEMQSHLEIISVVEYGPYWIFSYCEPDLTPEECPGVPMLKMRQRDGFSTYLHVQDKRLPGHCEACDKSRSARAYTPVFAHFLETTGLYSHCLEVENMENASHGIHFTDRFRRHASKDAVSPRKALPWSMFSNCPY
ncbi:hypothetical protein PG2022B_0083 [Bifidobacterium animalis subsp. animalis]|nr:hypothetical protein PG2022B_0083 [Bifidobacterium animalis subsp. animalis]